MNIYQIFFQKIKTQQNLFAEIIHKIDIKKNLTKIIFQEAIPTEKYATQKIFNQAIASLQHTSRENRLNAVYHLGKLIKNSPEYHWLIIEILSNFVRNYVADTSPASINNVSLLPLPDDIQAALTIIAHRDTKLDPENEQLDLSYSDMRGANLSKANLAQANLYRVNLYGANLAGANLCGTILSASDLTDTNLTGANLSGAILCAANLTGANLSRSNFSQSNLYLANLHQVFLEETIFTDANLREAKFPPTNTATA